MKVRTHVICVSNEADCGGIPPAAVIVINIQCAGSDKLFWGRDPK